ncbi:MAG: hypothetical protein ACK5DD_16610 [Cyclobacteriaceae bacterium]
MISSILSCAGQDGESLKPIAKGITAEVNLNVFSSTPISINYLRLRRFVNDRQAVRMGFSLGYQQQKPQDEIKTSTTEISLRPGYEWHFAGTNRLSPYMGFEIDLTLKSSTYTNSSQTVSPIKEIKGAWDTTGTEQGFTRIGANALIGADYYIARWLYMGLEIGYGFESVSFSDIEITSFNAGQSTPPVQGGSSLLFGPNFNSSVRLGFVLK